MIKKVGIGFYKYDWFRKMVSDQIAAEIIGCKPSELPKISENKSMMSGKDRTEAVLKLYEPDPANEHPATDLDKKSLENFMRLDEETRKKCIGVLLAKTPPDMLAEWKDQHKRGMTIGSNLVVFHSTIGMQIRNVLRGVLLDGGLPGVLYEDGHHYQNWDDFYMGALIALVEQEAEDPLYSPIR